MNYRILGICSVGFGPIMTLFPMRAATSHSVTFHTESDLQVLLTTSRDSVDLCLLGDVDLRLWLRDVWTARLPVLFPRADPTENQPLDSSFLWPGKTPPADITLLQNTVAGGVTDEWAEFKRRVRGPAGDVDADTGDPSPVCWL
uniref:Uncharacterized protein n=1 Tax=Oxyrrhis marina TaxID=2969 RepID=A0A7S4GPR9_OXYMA